MSCQPQSRVLIVYADTGSGHRSVARAIHSALLALSPGDSNEVVSTPIPGDVAPGSADTHTSLHNPVEHHLLGTLFDLYGPVTRRAPRLFTGAYHISNSERMCDLAGRVTYQLLHKQLVRLVEKSRPDLIVCVHSLLTQPMLHVLQRRKYDIPLFSVVTDLASIHQSWIAPDVDQCFVPTNDVRDEMIRRGMRSEQLLLSGLPVHPSYIASRDLADRESLRLALGLRPDIFTVLVMGGGEGIGGLDHITRHLATSQLPIQLIAVAGHNPALYKRLRKQQQDWRMPHRVFGFAHNVPDLMRASDVIVTKAGSVTIAEALTSGLPVIVSNVIEGQETGNVDFLVRNGVGFHARSASEVTNGVRRLLQLSETSMQDLRTRAHCLSTPTAAFDVASHILATLAKGNSVSMSDVRNANEPLPA